MGHWVLCNTYGTGAVTLKWDKGKFLTKFTHGVCDPEGPKRRTRGGEWMGAKTATRWTQLPTHASDSTTQVGQDHVATGVLLILGTNKQPPSQNSPTTTAETCTACCLCHTGQTDGLRRSDRWHRTDRCEDHVWFEDRWMVATLCDEWLTTLCGLILG
jgi:hypothetical protein